MSDDAPAEPEVVYLRSRTTQLEQRVRELEIDALEREQQIATLLAELAIERARL